MDWRANCKEDFIKNKKDLENKLKYSSTINSDMVKVIENGGILSSPHTILKFSGEMILEVVRSTYAADVSSIIALGVIHAGALAEEYSSRFERLFEKDCKGNFEEVFDEFKGGFFRSSDESTYGELPEFIPPDSWTLIRENNQLLENEFCLDYLHYINQLVAEVLDKDPIPVVPIYCGFSFDPCSGSFKIAKELAKEINVLNDGSTAILTTGDVVHFGHNYSEASDIKAKPNQIDKLEGYFFNKIKETFSTVFDDHNYWKGFELLNYELKSDQRLLLPVLSEVLLPQQTHFHFYDYKLSDYSDVWGVKKPSVVASAIYKLYAHE